MKRLFALCAFLAGPAAAYAADGHFTLPSGPGVATGPTAFLGDEDHPPEGCDATRNLSWMKEWRQRKRLGFANELKKNIPSLVSGAHCINDEDAYDVQYMKNGDYFVVSCLAQKKGRLSHFFQMDFTINPDPACLGDDRFNQYVKGLECKKPGGNREFLEHVMKPCNMTPSGAPTLRSPPRAVPIDPNFFARLLTDRPQLKEIPEVKSFMEKPEPPRVPPRRDGRGEERPRTRERDRERDSSQGCSVFDCGGSSRGDDDSGDAR